MRLIVSFLVILVCSAADPAREEYKRYFRKSLALPAGRAFHIDSRYGRITIRTQPKNEVDIQATIHCSAELAEQARRCADQIQIVVDENSTGVSVRTDYSRLAAGNPSYAADYDVIMPDIAPLDVRNQYGFTDIADLHASATIASGNGGVRFANGRGRQQIENTWGMVDVRKNEGDLTIHNSGSPTFATDITGRVEITNQYGEVRVTNTSRDVVIQSHNTNVQVSNVAGPVSVTNDYGIVTVTGDRSDLTVRNQGADITANNIAGKADLDNTGGAIKFSGIGKSLDVHISRAMLRGDTVGESARIAATFAPIDISGVAGPLTVEAQNGSVTVDAKSARRCQSVSIRTSYSPIRVTAAPNIGYNLTAHTTFGRIHSDLPIRAGGSIRDEEVEGKISGGGCDLRLMNQNGSIDILR